MNPLSPSEDGSLVYNLLRRSLSRTVVFALACLATASVAAAQQAPTNACQSEEFRQFDFWVGDWVVTQRDGSPAGTNKIELQLNDCVIQENWTGNGGSIGKSFNHYDRREKKWRQTWVDGVGGRLDLIGGLEGKAMVLRGEHPNRTGDATVLNEVTWTPKDDGSVEQHWRVSTDGGKTWNEAFFGIYRKK